MSRRSPAGLKQNSRGPAEGGCRVPKRQTSSRRQADCVRACGLSPSLQRLFPTLLRSRDPPYPPAAGECPGAPRIESPREGPLDILRRRAGTGGLSPSLQRLFPTLLRSRDPPYPPAAGECPGAPREETLCAFIP